MLFIRHLETSCRASAALLPISVGPITSLCPYRKSPRRTLVVAYQLIGVHSQFEKQPLTLPLELRPVCRPDNNNPSIMLPPVLEGVFLHVPSCFLKALTCKNHHRFHSSKSDEKKKTWRTLWAVSDEAIQMLPMSWFLCEHNQYNFLLFIICHMLNVLSNN